MESNNFDRDMHEWAGVDPDYKRLVLEAYSESEGFDIPNSDLDHAKFLSYLLIKKAGKRLRIFTGKLKEFFYSDEKIMHAFKDAVKRGVKIEVIIEHKEPECKKFVYELKDMPGVSIMRLNESKLHVKRHFLLSDDAAFRLEESHTCGKLDARCIKGFANFNSPNIVKKLSDIFDNKIVPNSMGM